MLYFTHSHKTQNTCCGRICTEFGTGVGVANAITSDIFWRSVKGHRFWGDRNLSFPTDKPSRR